MRQGACCANKHTTAIKRLREYTGQLGGLQVGKQVGAACWLLGCLVAAWFAIEQGSQS